MSKVTALEFFTTKEIFKIAPKIVADVYVMVALVSLQLEPLDVPWVDQRWNLSICVVGIETANSRKKLAFLVSIFPFAELPVLAIYKNSDDTLPTRFCKVHHAIIYVENDLFIQNAPSDTHKWGCCLQCDRLVWTFFVDAVFEKLLNICKRQATWHKHGWYYDNGPELGATELVLCWDFIFLSSW